jgi:hypothetical protein
VQNALHTETVEPAARAKSNKIAAVALILANLVIAGLALKEDWGFLQILYLFWFEAIIIGAFNVLKMFVVVVKGNPFGSWIGFENAFAAVFFALATVIFFVIKFGGFALTMGFVLLVLPVGLHELETGQAAENSTQFRIIIKAIKGVGSGLPWILATLVVSHGISFVMNFVGRREYERTNVIVLAFWPYARMALMLGVLVVAVVAAALLPGLAPTTTFAVTVVLLKLLADFISHRFEHSR